jgi:hypothetical protein
MEKRVSIRLSAVVVDVLRFAIGPSSVESGEHNSPLAGE